MVTENQLKEALQNVYYPDVTKDVVASGVVKIVDGVVHVTLPTMVAPEAVRDAVVKDVTDAVAKLGAKVEVSIKVASLPPPAEKNRMPRVKNVIAVASGKGGVGKSTVATNLALALQRWGAKVGMLDADVFGPSLPTMLGPPAREPGGTVDKRISPAIFHDLRVMSVAFFVDKGDAVVWRGPMVHKLLQQFVEDVEWGELDYLVVDFPPGTGDVQLSLSQLIPITGAVMVTTPQEVAVIDVVKGISMFKKVEVPILGVVENMAYYECPGCGHHDEIFGRGGGKKLAEDSGTTFLGEVPIDAKVRFGGDSGVPVVKGAPDSAHAKIFMDIASRVAGKIVSKVLSGPRRSASLVTIR
jgi:ATP-binding protein involved in chromosome partitioning